MHSDTNPADPLRCDVAIMADTPLSEFIAPRSGLRLWTLGRLPSQQTLPLILGEEPILVSPLTAPAHSRRSSRHHQQHSLWLGYRRRPHRRSRRQRVQQQQHRPNISDQHRTGWKGFAPNHRRLTSIDDELSLGGEARRPRPRLRRCAHLTDEGAHRRPLRQSNHNYSGTRQKVGFGRSTVHCDRRAIAPHFQIISSSPDLHFDDVAVLTLEKAVSGVTPVKFADSDNGGLYQSGNTGTVFGWGDHSDRHLAKATVPVVSDSCFDVKYKNDKQSPAAMKQSLFCAGDTMHDACNGDSGGLC